MIIMLVRKENCIEFLDLDSVLLEQEMKLLARESCVYQYCTFTSSQSGCIARTAGSQNFKVNLHRQRVKKYA